MTKPITVAREELARTLVDAINTSGLPAFVIVDLLDPLTRTYRELAVQQYEADKVAFEKEDSNHDESD